MKRKDEIFLSKKEMQVYYDEDEIWQDREDFLESIRLLQLLCARKNIPDAVIQLIRDYV